MLEKRYQGRPKHGDAQVGRDKIVSGFVEMVRSGHHGNISRKEIAQYIGITPALITYYFPKGHLLLIDSFSNVFAPWHEKLDQLLLGNGDYDEKLTAALELIVAFYKREFFVEIFYADLCRRGVISDSIVDRLKHRLADFLDQDPAASAEDMGTSEVLSNVIWGACQQCARLEHPDAVYEIVRRLAVSRPLASAGALTRSMVPRGASAMGRQWHAK